MIIASELFKIRSRFNRYNFHEDEFIDLLQLYTDIEIGTENEKNEISWHIDKDYYPESKLNLLIYFIKHYKEYAWNDEIGIFINMHNIIIVSEKEDELFQLLNSKNDKIALDAFIQLSVSNPLKVIQLSDEYERADIDHNYSLPIFPFRFLKQIVVLTDYCRKNEIDYIGSTSLRNNIKMLDAEMSFAERRALENILIDSLTLDDITAFEYWALINESSDRTTYSAGRILDVFYSKNWKLILENNKHLNCYLKKSKLFDQLGIIGICNNYLNKFLYISAFTLKMLNDYKSSDSDIQNQANKIISLNLNLNNKKDKILKDKSENKSYNDDALIEEFIQLLSQKKSEELKSKLCFLLSAVKYSQIPIAFKYLDSFDYDWLNYSFLKNDFGLLIMDNFFNKKIRKAFIESYSKLSEYQLYAYYLDNAEIDYKNNDQTLNYDKIYELIKYDVVVAFVGGGGGTKDNEVYSLIKLLEISFNTTMGFPDKLCECPYTCNSEDRAKVWMNYLEDNKLLQLKHDTPISFHYE